MATPPTTPKPTAAPSTSIWSTLLPYLITGGITGGTALASGILTNKATAKATDAQVAASEKAAQLTRLTAQEQLDQLRQIYNIDMGLQWPTVQTGAAGLRMLNRSMGTGVSPSAFAVPDKPPQLRPFTNPGTDTSGNPIANTGNPDLSSALLSADATLKPAGTLGPMLNKGVWGGVVGGRAVGVVSSLAGGAASGTLLGSWGTPIGMAVGAGLGALTSLIGRGRKEADTIVPYQNALTSDIGTLINNIKAKDAAGTLTSEDWQAAVDHATKLKEQFNGFTQDFGRAGPGGRESISSWLDPMLEQWKGYAANTPPVAPGTPGRRWGGPVYARAGGGFTRPQGTYLVGEVGPEVYDPNQPGIPSTVVGANGPEVFNPPYDGKIIPNNQLTPRQAGGPVTGQPKVHKVMREFAQGALRSSSGEKVTDRAQAIAIAMSEAGMSRPQHREFGGPVYSAFTRPRLIHRASGGGVLADLNNWGWQKDASGNNWTHPQTGATGYFTAGGQFVNAKANKIYDPMTGQSGDYRQPPPTRPSAAPNAGNNQQLQNWGWNKDPGGNFKFTATGDTGHWATGGFVNDTQGKIWDPNSGKLQDYLPGGSPAPPTPGKSATTTPNPYATMGQDIPTAATPTDQPMGDWQWDEGAGHWWNPKSGTVYNPKTDLLSDPNDPNRGNWSRYEPTQGESLQPWQGNFAPDTSGLNNKFSFDPGSAGYQPFNAQFSFDPGSQGYQPFNKPFSFDPAAGGYQALNKPFEFNAADMQKDPGYQFRLQQGENAIESSAAARGLLTTGRTGKELSRYSQDYASNEYGKAYDRAQTEFGLARQGEQTAYQRAMSEFGLSQQQAQEAYTRATAEFERNSGQTKEAYIRAKEQFGTNYEQALAQYDRELEGYTRAYAEFIANRNTRSARINAIAGMSNPSAP